MHAIVTKLTHTEASHNNNIINNNNNKATPKKISTIIAVVLQYSIWRYFHTHSSVCGFWQDKITF